MKSHPTPPIYSTIVSLYKDQHQGHKYFMPQNIWLTSSLITWLTTANKVWRLNHHLVVTGNQQQKRKDAGGSMGTWPLSSDREASVWKWTREKCQHHLPSFTSHHHSLTGPRAASVPGKILGTQEGWLHIMTEGHRQSAGRRVHKPARYLISCFIGPYGPFLWKGVIHPQTDKKFHCLGVNL